LEIQGIVFTEFSEVTELAGSEITEEQLQRMLHRYGWAARYCRGKDVVEVACGSGQGLGILASVSRSLEAGDYSDQILEIARAHYGSRVRVTQLDAQSLPYADGSKDVIILFEAIYYIPDATRFVQECRRVLRPGGRVLVATANKDLWDFSPSPLSHSYYGAAELVALFAAAGFRAEVYGYMPVEQVSWRQRIMRPVKRLAVGMGIMPKSLKGKRLLKRFVFGRMIAMPAELPASNDDVESPTLLLLGEPDRRHKVLYCCATRSAG
jgi:ubiquinone/menaquinone biosynthesis C-methylase UbiE